jgi:CRP-like cAMP-binding protein
MRHQILADLLEQADTLAAPDVISRAGWLAACARPFADWVVKTLQWRLVQPGTGISFAGDAEGGFFCLGRGQITFQTSLGSTLVTGYFGYPGSWWGQAPLLGLPRTGTVTTRTESILGILPLRALEARLADHPEGWADIARGAADLFRMSAGAHADLLIECSRNRIAATLLRLGGNRHRYHPVLVPRFFECTQDELARATGVSRNTAGVHLRNLEREGLVRIGYGQIEILDSRALTAIADADC